MRRVRRGSISSELLMCGGGVHSISLLPLVARYLVTIDVCIWRRLILMSVVVTVWVSVEMFVVQQPLLKIVFFFTLECVFVRDVMDVVLYVCIMRRGAVGARVWDVVSYVHPVAVLNAAFCMTCSLLMLVEDERGDHVEEEYSRAGLMTLL